MFKQFVGMAIISTFLWAIALGSFSIAPLQGRVIHRIWNRQKKHWSSEDTLIVSTHLDSAHIHHGFNVDCLTDGRACLSLAGSIISPHQSSTYISYLYVVDMDKDDDIDVVTTISHGVRNVGIEWHENLGDGSIWYTHTVSEICGLDQLVVTDIDNDGDYDIMSCKHRVGENFDIIWFEQIDDNWLEHKIIGSNTGAETIEAADIDLDGDPDFVILALLSPSRLEWWENINPDENNWEVHLIDSSHTYTNSSFRSPRFIEAANLDLDTNLELVVTTAGEVLVFDEVDLLTNSWNVDTLALLNDPYDWFSNSTTADIDQDMDLDVVYCLNSMNPMNSLSSMNDFGCQIVWCENQSSRWIKHLVADLPVGIRFLTCGDIDNDFDVDIFGQTIPEGWHQGPLGTISWWENTGSTDSNWKEHKLSYTCSGWNVRLADINGDSWPDVLGANSIGAGLSEFVDFESYSGSGIRWYNLQGYASSGELISDPLSIDINRRWAFIDWDAIQPEGTNITFYVRSAGNWAFERGWIWSEWSRPIHNPDSLWDYIITSPRVSFYTNLNDGIQYRSRTNNILQYKVVLETNDPSITPILEEVSITWQ